MVWVVVVALILELGLHFVGVLWRRRRVVAPACAFVTAFAAGMLVTAHFTAFSVLLGIISLYRIFNMIRVIEERMHERYLRHSTRRTSIVLIGLQSALAAVWWAWEVWQPPAQVVWAVIAGLQLLVAFVLFAALLRRLKHTAWPVTGPHIADAGLPTITVAIPARNETDDLQECLRSVIDSNYPKLEVLVLDDCSQTARTPEIIRSFAQAGVRFVQGEEPKSTWLAKNQAYDRLLQAASGEYVVFCGVDMRFSRDSLRQLVTLTLAKHKDMLCVLPWRLEAAKGFALTQAMRYWWELVPPRRLLHRPPVLSTCWIARKDALTKAGGFAAVARTIVPEAFFARQLAASDMYSFVRASARSGIQSTKSTAAQQVTAIRTRYPQLRRRPENVCTLFLGQVLFFILLFLMVIGGAWLSVGWIAFILAVAASLLLIATYQLLSLSTRTGNWWFGLTGLLAGTVYDIGLVHYSMWRYEFAEVEWKGRNVCIPAMHVIPRLPRV